MLRLRQICLVAPELTKSVAQLESVLGLKTCFHDPGVEKYGLNNALLPIGTNFLEVVAPFQDGTTTQRYMDRRGGSGGYMVIMQCDDVEKRRHRWHNSTFGSSTILILSTPSLLQFKCTRRTPAEQL